MTTAEFKTMFTLDTTVSNLEEEIDGRRCKMSKRESSSRILEAGLLLSDQEKIIVMTSVVPSGQQVSRQSPQTAAPTEVITSTTTTEKEVEAV